jgi:hypothetical protein
MLDNRRRVGRKPRRQSTVDTAERILRGRVYIEHEKWITFGLDVLDAARLSFTAVGPADESGLDSLRRAVLFLSVRAFRAADASFLLFQSGWGHEAFITLRTLFEHLIDLKYLLKNPSTVSDFWKYAAVGHFRYILAAERYLPTQPFAQEYKELVTKNYEAVKDRFPSEVRWSRKTFAARVKDLAEPVMEEQYAFIYQACSEYVHSGPMTYPRYFVEAGGVTDIQLGGHVPDRPDLVVFMTGILLQVMEAYDSVFELKQRDLFLGLVKKSQALTGTRA